PPTITITAIAGPGEGSTGRGNFANRKGGVPTDRDILPAGEVVYREAVRTMAVVVTVLALVDLGVLNVVVVVEVVVEEGVKGNSYQLSCNGERRGKSY